MQLDALRATGCRRVWSDTASRSLNERSELVELFDHLRPGDTLVVWRLDRLDRLGRSARHLIDLVGEFGQRGVGQRSLQGGIETTTAGGRVVFHVFSALDSSNAKSSSSARGLEWRPPGQEEGLGAVRHDSHDPCQAGDGRAFERRPGAHTGGDRRRHGP